MLKFQSLNKECNQTYCSKHSTCMNMNIRNNHTLELRIKIELYEDHRNEGVST